MIDASSVGGGCVGIGGGGCEVTIVLCRICHSRFTSFLDAFGRAPERPAERHDGLAYLAAPSRRHDGVVVAVVLVAAEDTVVPQDRGTQGRELWFVQDDLVKDRVEASDIKGNADTTFK